MKMFFNKKSEKLNNMIKKSVSIAMMVALILTMPGITHIPGGIAQEAKAATGSLSTNKMVYRIDEAINVTATCTGDGSWVGIYPSGVKPEESIAIYWYYVYNTSGGIDRRGQTHNLKNYDNNQGGFNSLTEGQNYDLYLFGNGNYDDVVKKVTIRVTPWTNYTVSTNKTTYNCGEAINVIVKHSYAEGFDNQLKAENVGLYKRDEATTSGNSLYWEYTYGTGLPDYRGGTPFNILACRTGGNPAAYAPNTNYKIVLFDDYDSNSAMYETHISVNSNHTYAYKSEVTKAATCGATGTRKLTCFCGATKTETIAATNNHTWKDATCTAAKTCTTCGATSGSVLSHNYTFSKSGTTITKSCNKGCNFSATATLNDTTNSRVYTGNPITALKVDTSSNWPAGDTITSSNLSATNAGTYTGKISVGGQEVTKSYTISKATNQWTTAPTVSNGIYGEKDYTATAVAKFGSVNITYKNRETGATISKPTLPGKYTAVFTVADHNNYTGLSQSIDFDINLTEYTLSYNLDGGTVSIANPTTYNRLTETFNLNNPTKTGYTFAGWTGTGLGSATQTVAIPKESYGDRSYTANWTPNTYTLSYNANTEESVTGMPTNQDWTYGTDITLSNNKPERTGYTFKGWAESADATQAQYTAGTTISGSGQWTSDKVLYAVWEKSDVSLTVNISMATDAVIRPAHGTPVAIFRLQNKDSGKVYYQAAEFDLNIAESVAVFFGADLIEKEVSFEGLETGTYTLTQVDTYRYDPLSGMPDGDITLTGDQTISVVNKVATDQWFGHNALYN